MSKQVDYSQFILKAAEMYKEKMMYNRYGILKDAADQFKFMSEQIDKLNTDMPCGHLVRYAVNGEDGTQYCSMCVVKSANIIIASFECYTAINKPETQWDEYDSWIFPAWRNLYKLLRGVK